MSSGLSGGHSRSAKKEAPLLLGMASRDSWAALGSRSRVPPCPVRPPPREGSSSHSQSPRSRFRAIQELTVLPRWLAIDRRVSSFLSLIVRSWSSFLLHSPDRLRSRSLSSPEGSGGAFGSLISRGFLIASFFSWVRVTNLVEAPSCPLCPTFLSFLAIGEATTAGLPRVASSGEMTRPPSDSLPLKNVLSAPLMANSGVPARSPPEGPSAIKSTSGPPGRA